MRLGPIALNMDGIQFPCTSTMTRKILFIQVENNKMLLSGSLKSGKCQKTHIWNDGAPQRITLTVQAGCHELVVPNMQNIVMQMVIN